MYKYIKEQIIEWDNLYKEQADFYHRAAIWSGLSDTAYLVMFYVCWKEETISQSELCADHSYPKQTINSAVTKLLKQELVTLESSTKNNKRKIIKLTSEGKIFCDKYIKPILSIKKDSFSEIDRDEIDQMLLTMRKQLNIMKEKADKVWQ